VASDLRLIDGQASPTGRRAAALVWHPSHGGRPPAVCPTGHGSARERARTIWGGVELGADGAAITPVHRTVGMVIEIAAWR